jgi:TolB protein
MNKNYNAIARIVTLFIVLLGAVSLQAQQSPGQVILQVTDHLALYEVGPDGQRTLLATLPGSFGMLYNLNVEWNIPTWREIVTSPDGQYIAFVAYQLQGGETALFIYDVNQSSLTQVNLPGLGSIHWSPGSDAIALAPPEEYLDFAISLDRVYVYDLPADALVALPENSFAPLLWLPDNQRIVYVGPRLSCDDPCVVVRNLFVTDRTGGNSVALTDLGTQIPAATSVPFMFCFPQELLWNDVQQRIFYSLNCLDETERRLDLLYSVTLSQDNRFEGSLVSLFPNDTYSAILDIFPSENTSYIAVDGFSQPYIGGTESGYGAWRVLRLDEPGTLTVIAEHIVDTNLWQNLINAELSPDQESLAIGGYDPGIDATGYVAVIDLSSGQVISEQQTPNQVCNVQWVDNQEFVYTEYPDSNCNFYQPPGNTILYDLQTSSGQIVNNTGETLLLLAPPEVPSGSIPPTPENGPIVYVSKRTGNWEVYKMNPDGSDDTQLTNYSGKDWGPSWSPDGSKIVFESLRHHLSGELYTMNADGSNVTRLTSNTFYDDWPDYSPDGSQIVFVSERSGSDDELWVMNADGSGQTLLYDSAGDDTQPAWSPDGTKIAFASNQSGNWEVYVIPSTGGTATNLTNHPALDNIPAWSADGSQIAWVSNRTGFDVYAMPATGGAATNISNHGDYDSYPSYSADGALMAFISRRDGENEVWTMTVTGATPVQLTFNTAVEWDPDWVALTAGNQALLSAPAVIEAAIPDNTPRPSRLNALPRGKSEQTHANLFYVGAWVDETVAGTSVRTTHSIGGEVWFAFRGRQVILHIVKRPDALPIEVCIDDVCQSIDLYSAQPALSSITLGDLSAGTHTVHLRNDSAGYLSLDAIEVP